ncbi:MULTISPECIES: hypothetical protein [unclassified Algibacter]|uniref:hypothetical protein n=1 Tax=unclassified Algibacter TaxID=2615009 RepID=UPI00131A94E5|nr:MULTISPECIES: hypothetical protein [unclassified Algibacter]MCL5128271.1 hypothetical protein [Algibacter sp. L4_22]
METKTKLTLEFYQHLGKLFYAIAAADKKVHPDEFNKLKELVKLKWLHLDLAEDHYHTNAAYHIEIVFDWLNNGAYEAETCFHDFVNYKNENPELFTKVIKKLIMKTANAIASSFSGLNKSELIMLAKLEMELKSNTCEKA